MELKNEFRQKELEESAVVTAGGKPIKEKKVTAEDIMEMTPA